MLPVLGFSGRSSLFTKNLNFKTQFDAGKHGITYYYQVLYQREFKQGLELIHSRNFANQKSMFSFLLINDSPSPATNSDWWTKNYKSTDKIDSSKEDFISVGICSAKVCENKAGFYVNQALIYYDRDLKSYFAQKFIFSAL